MSFGATVITDTSGAGRCGAADSLEHPATRSAASAKAGVAEEQSRDVRVFLQQGPRCGAR